MKKKQRAVVPAKPPIRPALPHHVDNLMLTDRLQALFGTLDREDQRVLARQEQILSELRKIKLLLGALVIGIDGSKM